MSERNPQTHENNLLLNYLLTLQQTVHCRNNIVTEANNIEITGTLTTFDV